MDKARLEWVISGLNQCALTDAENLFIKNASADFDKNDALTDRQEARLENLYKEKSRLLPNKKSDRFSVNPSPPKRPGIESLAEKYFDVNGWRNNNPERMDEIVRSSYIPLY